MDTTHKFNRDLYLKSGESVGYIRLVIYKTGSKAVEHPQLEYEIEEKYRNQGIMSQELPKYLEHVLEKGEEVIIALCKEDNFVSKKLLERNGFCGAGKIEDNLVFVIFKKFLASTNN